ncbi:hypothetical protein FFI16_015290 [Pseudomonas sp. KBS0710]|nr:hypothetical protein FFI16_015290 [Pseudomonas sp. KBS0710]
MHAQKLLKWEILPIAQTMPVKRRWGKGHSGGPVLWAGLCGRWSGWMLVCVGAGLPAMQAPRSFS